MLRRKRWGYLSTMFIVSALLSIGLLSTNSVQASGNVSGTVFLDLNNNGIYNPPNEPGVANVTVTAYDSSNTASGSATTAANGTYTLSTTGTGPYRIEFSNLPAGAYPAPQDPLASATGSGSTVQFVNDPGTGNTLANINLSLHYPSDFCEENPEIATNCFIGGPQLSTARTIARFPYTTSGSATPGVNQAFADEVGATWGLAYQPSSDSLFAAAYMKRHTLFGPGGTGQIYRIDNAGNVSSFINIPNTGLDPHSQVVSVGATNTTCQALALPPYTVPTSTGRTGQYACSFHDPEAFNYVGRIGLGDLDLYQGPSGDALFTVNLNDRQMYRVTNLSATPTVTPFSMPLGLPGVNPLFACPATDVQPFGLTFWRGSGYAGLVCTAETSQLRSQLAAYVYRFNPDTGIFDTAPLAQFSLNYTRGFADNPLSANWNPWISSFIPFSSSSWANGDETSHPQPMLSDIAFDSVGNMTLGFRDRYADQMGARAGTTTTTNHGTYLGVSGGDILKVCLVGGVYQLESNGSCGGLTSTPTGPTQSPLQGPGGREFYYADAFFNDSATLVEYHEELAVGGLGYHPSRNEVLTTVFDPLISPRFDSGGVRRYNVNTGAQVGAFEMYIGEYDDNPPFLGKAAGMGDLELLCSSAPIEIGNRVWLDTDNDGLQDAGEAALGGIIVELYDSAGNLVSTTTTDSNGNYLFSSANNTNQTHAAYNLPLNPNETYSIRIPLSQPNLASYLPTTANTVADHIDSDGDTSLYPGYSAVNITLGSAGHNNHTYDFGFFNNVATPTNTPTETPVPPTATSTPTNTPTETPVPPTATSTPTETPVPPTATSTPTNTPTETPVPPTATNTPTETPVPPTATNTSTATPTNTPTNTPTATPTNTPVPAVVYSLGNRVWFDDNNNGLIDAGEAGVDGVTITLYAADGTTVLSTTTTIGGGYYLFDNLPAGDYIVAVDASNFAPGGALFGYHNSSPTEANPNADIDNNDNGINSTSYLSDGIRSGTVTLGPTEPTGETDLGPQGTGQPDDRSNLTVDFGFYTMSLGNQVWIDTNNNGVIDAGETGLDGVTVNLYAADGTTLLGTTTTTNGGYYLFTGLQEGDYIVEIVPPAGYTSSTGTGNAYEPAPDPDTNPTDSDDNGTTNGTVIRSLPVTLGAGSEPTGEPTTPGHTNPAPDANSNLTVDFGLIPLASIGDYVWFDQNGDGVQDVGEPPISGVVVHLLDPNGNIIATTTTDSNGYYIFDQLPPGDYAIQFVPPSGYTYTIRDSSNGNDANDSDPDPLTGRTIITTLDPGEHDPTWDAGFIIDTPTSISLQSLTVDHSNQQTTITWQTTVEYNTRGFYIYYSPTPNRSDAIRVTNSLISAHGSHNPYTWVHQISQGGYYWLQEVEINGITSEFGPFEARILPSSTYQLYLPNIMR
jgi:protocatechuate 3,4-dioxygenase beta subunit